MKQSSCWMLGIDGSEHSVEETIKSKDIFKPVDCDIAYDSIAGMRVVIDTNVVVGAMLREGGASREILRRCLIRELQPLIGLALFLELEDVLKRGSVLKTALLNEDERSDLFQAFLSTTTWVPIFYRWRPNLRDEADNHIMELAVAGNSECIITKNQRDFKSMDLKFNDMKIMTPADFLERGREK